MTKIFVVGSVHEERGLTSVSALVGALERLHPEVIFQEIPTSLNEEQILNGTKQTLEAKAVEIYRKANPVKLVPVDLPTPEISFFSNNSYLLQRIERTSREYCRLMDWHSQYVKDYGFPYLNSAHCDKLWDELDGEISMTVRAMNEQGLTDLYDLWNQTIECRDLEMLANIRKYCLENTLERGLFLVGVSHRRSIRRKTAKFGGFNESNIVWEFLDSDSARDNQNGA